MFRTVVATAALLFCLCSAASAQYILYGDARDAGTIAQWQLLHGQRRQPTPEQEARDEFEREHAHQIKLANRIPAPPLRTETDRKLWKEFKDTVVKVLIIYFDEFESPDDLPDMVPFHKLPKEEAAKMSKADARRYKFEVSVQKTVKQLLALEQAEKERDRAGASAALKVIRAEAKKAATL